MTRRYYIDRCMIFNGTVIVIGWCEELPTAQISIECGGRALMSVLESVPRPDLEPIYGGEAASWGFTLRGLLRAGESGPHIDDALVIRISAPGADEVVIERPSQRFWAGGSEPELFRDFRRMLIEEGARTVLEIGARARTGVTRRQYFPPPFNYVGVDVAPGPNVDIAGDAHHLSRLVSSRFDAAFSVATFEHLLMPWKVVLELHKILRDGGLVYTHSPQAWPIHDAPWDFWRFSQESWRGLFNRHTGFEIVAAVHGEPGFLVPAFSLPHLWGIDQTPCYLGSACIARKIGEAEVAWGAEMEGLYDLNYSHGPRDSAELAA
jgi:hypothetical protein